MMESQQSCFIRSRSFPRITGNYYSKIFFRNSENCNKSLPKNSIWLSCSKSVRNNFRIFSSTLQQSNTDTSTNIIMNSCETSFRDSPRISSSDCPVILPQIPHFRAYRYSTRKIFKKFYENTSNDSYANCSVVLQVISSVVITKFPPGLLQALFLGILQKSFQDLVSRCL